ncbi:DNA helicase, phage-associated [Vibrio ishigakensis]|uniref:DNA helicase, phage-associated n=2 Tax=Vibrio ishigakensis TaxID=1481914 RepID=A0A0B8P4F0_9VIBR|nr:DNA helicase, phage-associated [Vibrio ishigakensis]
MKEQLNLFPITPLAEDKEIKIGEMLLSKGSTNFEFKTEWLIKGLLPSESLCMLCAAHSTLKTFTALDLSCAISTGLSWNGRKTRKSKVLYIAAEGQKGISKRIKAWEIANQELADDVLVLGRSVEITNALQMRNLIQIVKETSSEDGSKIELVVIDTLSQCLVGDENSSRDMTAFIRACSELRHEAGVSVLIVHHAGKDASKGPRGHSSLPSNIEAMFRVTHNKKRENSVIFHNDKQKDMDTADKITLDFSVVDLGISDDEGEPVTSLARFCSNGDTQHQPRNSKTYTQPESDDHKIISFLRSFSSGEATRGSLKKHFFGENGPLDPRQRQNFKRILDKLRDDELVTVKQASERAHDSDLISINIH